ncbi:MAG: SRPBCC family protein [Deltaproteobacteria bacterium]|nr:SRPBCC family protein [Deltaproteobacteria bacterium]
MGKCVHSAVINAPVDQVWQVLRNFHDLSWTKAIESLEPVGDGVDQRPRAHFSVSNH